MVSWTLSARARLLLTFILLISGVALRIAGDCSSTGSKRACRVVPALIIDPNSAPPEVLESLPHVGPSLVRQLVEQRRIRPFRSIDEMRRRVRGLGPATLAKLAPHLRITARSDSASESEIHRNRSAPGQTMLVQEPRTLVGSR